MHDEDKSKVAQDLTFPQFFKTTRVLNINVLKGFLLIKQHEVAIFAKVNSTFIFFS